MSSILTNNSAYVALETFVESTVISQVSKVKFQQVKRSQVLATTQPSGPLLPQLSLTLVASSRSLTR